MRRNPFCSALRRRSGRVNSRDPLVRIYYGLLELVPGDAIEALLLALERESPPWRFTNGWVAKYAIDLARRTRAALAEFPGSEDHAREAIDRVMRTEHVSKPIGRVLANLKRKAGE